MRLIRVMVFVLLSFGLLAGGCASKKETPTAANKEAFTGPEMPAEARAKMQEEQAKAMAKAGDTTPKAGDTAPKDPPSEDK